MRECAKVGSPEAACVCNTGLAMNVLFGDAIEGLSAARGAVAIATADASARPYLLGAQSRLIVVLLYRGMLYLPANASIIQAAAHGIQFSGDLFLRAVVEMNLGVSHMDAGELDRADVAFGRVGRIVGSADLGLLRLNHLYNLGELAIHQRDYDGAEAVLHRADDLLSPLMPSYMGDLVRAGLGLCALETGRLSEARRREEELSDPPSVWYFDPTLIVWFRARLLERRGRLEEAAHLLREQSEDLEGRLVPAWLKIRLLEVQIAEKAGLADARHRATEAMSVAESLHLAVRASQFADALSRLAG